MALFHRLRAPFRSLHLRHFSVLSQDSSAVLSARQKSRAALSLLKSEESPDKILEICRAAALTPEVHIDRICFSVAISKLAQSNHFDTIHSFLQELRQRSDLRNERFAAHSLILYGQAKMFNRAISTFDELYKERVCHSVKSLNALLLAGVFAGEYGELKRIFLEFPRKYGIEPDLDTYNTVIKAFSESGSSSSVYSLLAEMERKGIKPDAASFGHALDGFYREEKYEDVGKLLNMMKEKGVKVGVNIYNIRIKSLCKAKRSAEAKALFDGMLSRGLKPNPDTYSHMIHGFAAEGNLEEAKELFKSTKKKGHLLDANCHFTLVGFLCKGGDFEAAYSVCKESMEKNWIPNLGTMQMLVKGLASISKAEEARELVNQMKKFPKNAHLWEEIEKELPQE